MEEIYKKITSDKMNIFLMVSLSGTIVFFIWLIVSSDSQPFNWLVMEHNYNWQFSDFFRQIVYSSDLHNIYFNTNDVPFPPLAYMFFHLIYRLNPTKYNIDLFDWQKAELYQYNLLIFLMIEVINILLLLHIVKKHLEKYNNKKVLVFFISILLSAPFFVGVIERGNPALITLTLILYSLYYKNSDNKKMRQVSLILLAIATGFKLYPAILIVLWIKEKKYKDVKRFILYCLVFVILPFTFTGGINGFIKYSSNLLTNFSGNIINMWTSIEPFGYAISQTLNLGFNPIVTIVIKYLFLILGITLAIITKEKKKVLIPLATLMAVFLTLSYRYVSIYMIIPLIYFLKEDCSNYSKIDFTYILLFGLIFTIPVWAFMFEVDFAIFIMIYIINIVFIIESIYNLKKKNKRKLQTFV